MFPSTSFQFHSQFRFHPSLQLQYHHHSRRHQIIANSLCVNYCTLYLTRSQRLSADDTDIGPMFPNHFHSAFHVSVRAPILAMPALTPAGHPNIPPDGRFIMPSLVLLTHGPVGPYLMGGLSFGSLAAEETLLYLWGSMSLVFFLFSAFYPRTPQIHVFDRVLAFSVSISSKLYSTTLATDL